MQLPLHTGRFPHVWMIAVPSVAEAIAAAYSKDKAGMIWRLHSADQARFTAAPICQIYSLEEHGKNGGQ